MKADDKALLAWTILTVIVFIGTYLIQGDFISAIYAGGLIAIVWIANLIGNYFYEKTKRKRERERERKAEETRL